jgi:hypothetical protein
MPWGRLLCGAGLGQGKNGEQEDGSHGFLDEAIEDFFRASGSVQATADPESRGPGARQRDGGAPGGADESGATPRGTWPGARARTAR